MTLHVFLFWVIAGLTGLSAIAAVATQNIVRSATWLFFTLAGTSGIFFLLGADLVGVIQLLVYVGGTLVLVVFGVMLTAQGPFINMKTSGAEWGASTVVGVLLMGVLSISALSIRNDARETYTLGKEYRLGLVVPPEHLTTPLAPEEFRQPKEENAANGKEPVPKDNGPKDKKGKGAGKGKKGKEVPGMVKEPEPEPIDPEPAKGDKSPPKFVKLTLPDPRLDPLVKYAPKGRLAGHEQRVVAEEYEKKIAAAATTEEREELVEERNRKLRDLQNREAATSPYPVIIGQGLMGRPVGPAHKERSGGRDKVARTHYLFPFEIVSMHLLVVLIGAAYLARAKRRRGQGPNQARGPDGLPPATQATAQNGAAQAGTDQNGEAKR